MTAFRFRSIAGRNISPQRWVRMWAKKFPATKYAAEHDRLIGIKEVSPEYFVRIGRWKDAAASDAKWRPNVASVAYRVWMAAAAERPACPDEAVAPAFLASWSGRTYKDRYPAGKLVVKRFGLSRATTLLYFLSRGRFPIFDSRVRRGIVRLNGLRIPNTVTGYMEVYRPVFLEIANRCGTDDLRLVDQALFSYGARVPPFPT